MEKKEKEGREAETRRGVMFYCARRDDGGSGSGASLGWPQGRGPLRVPAPVMAACANLEWGVARQTHARRRVWAFGRVRAPTSYLSSCSSGWLGHAARR